jgi:hypothetical protein
VTRLYGRDTLLTEVVPQLVGLHAHRPELVAQANRDDPPALLLAGPHGSGRTAVLSELARWYRDRLPVALVDCARGSDGAAAAGGAAVANTSPGAELLTDVARGLCGPVHRRRRIRLPRLWTGLAAVTAWNPGDTQEETSARDRMRRLLTGCGLEEEGSPEADRWVADVHGALPAGAPNDLPTIAGTAVRLLTSRGYVSNDQAHRAAEFYTEQLGSDRATAPWNRLCRAFRAGEDALEETEASLAAALLADLDAHYGRLARFNRLPRPLLLLDDAHTAPGTRLLGQLLTPRAAGVRDPLIVVAAARGGARHPGRPDATVRTLAQLAGGTGTWRRPDTRTPSAGIVAVDLPPLGRSDIVTMLMGLDPPPLPEVPRAVRRFTQGSPMGCGLLRDAVEEDPRGRAASGHELAGLELGGRAVTRRIAERLVPDAVLGGYLRLFCVARDAAAAQALAARYLSTDPRSGAAVATVRSHLRAEHGARPAEPFVADPFLRAVLVHELRRLGPGSARPAESWTELHALLRGHHEEAGQPVEAWHHALAGGTADEVSAGLALRLGSGVSPGQWLRDLWLVASAPHPPGGAWAERCRAVAKAEPGTEVEGDDVRRSVHRLLHAVWLAAEPLTVPDDTLCGRIKWELELLSSRHSTGAGVLFDAAREWHDALRDLRTPSSALPAPGSEGNPGETR